MSTYEITDTDEEPTQADYEAWASEVNRAKFEAITEQISLGEAADRIFALATDLASWIEYGQRILPKE